MVIWTVLCGPNPVIYSALPHWDVLVDRSYHACALYECIVTDTTLCLRKTVVYRELAPLLKEGEGNLKYSKINEEK